MQEKIVVIIPAHNEAEIITPLLESLQRIRADGIVHEIIVINDGSTDKTPEKARKTGVKVISLEKNMGKAFAFYKGAQAAKAEGATILVTLDADIAPVKEQTIQALIEPLQKKTIDLSIGATNLGYNDLSGQRAIRMKALEPLLNGNRKWGEYFGISRNRAFGRLGFGLERALNLLIKKYAVSGAYFYSSRRATARWDHRAHYEMEKPEHKLIERGKDAKRLWQLRKIDPKLAKRIRRRLAKKRRTLR